MLLDARCTKQLITVQTLGARLPVLSVHQFAKVTDLVLGWFLSVDDFTQVGHQKVVRQLFHSTEWKRRSLAAQRTGELAIIAVLLVGALRVGVVLDAFFAKCVQAVEALGAGETFQTYLTCEEFLVDLLCENAALRTCSWHLVAVGRGSWRSALDFVWLAGRR